jgi:purine-cytosine permease-like protein
VNLIRGSTAIAGFVVALVLLSGAFAFVVADRDDNIAWLVAGIGAVGVLMLPLLVLLVLNIWRTEEREPYSLR